ncbi:MAG TPA: PilZ domain-containing protein [Nitrospiraceae bacterium]|nr:PilZ domain-containing protein [Nitrospiraceae bacterium]
MATDKPELLQAFFSKGVFRGTCPACLASHNFAPAEFTGKTIAYTCPCGRLYTVLPLGLRGGQRKAVNLSGILSGKPGKSLLKIPCLVRDLSTKGIGITLDVTSAEMAETMQLRVKLDDLRKTALLLPCKVRRKQKAGGQLLLGLEFKPLDLDSQSALARYLAQ